MKLNINKFDGRKIGENEEILQINDRTKDICKYQLFTLKNSIYWQKN